MSEIRNLPAQAARVETGPVQFGDDWPGVFIRGDRAGYYAMLLGQAIEAQGTEYGPILMATLEGLRRTLARAVVGPAAVMLKRPALPIRPDGLPWGTPRTVPRAERCAECGIKLEPVMGYVCNRGERCPTGLAGPTCSVLDACGTSGCKVTGA